jgi:nitrogen fixation NifU-like protein
MARQVLSYICKPPPVNDIETKAKASGERITTLPLARLHFILSRMYSDAVLKHFRSPHNTGDLPDATAIVEVTNPVCGDVLRLSVRMAEGRIAAAGFKTQGCVASIASSSMLTDLLAGKTHAEAESITAQQIADALDGLPPASFHGAQLCADALGVLLRKLA